MKINRFFGMTAVAILAMRSTLALAHDVSQTVPRLVRNTAVILNAEDGAPAGHYDSGIGFVVPLSVFVLVVVGFCFIAGVLIHNRRRNRHRVTPRQTYDDDEFGERYAAPGPPPFPQRSNL